MSGKKIEVINPDAILTLKMSAQFYQRIQAMMLTISEEHTPAEVKNAIERIKSDAKDLLPWEDMLLTVIMMINNIEDQARKDGHLTFKDVKPFQST